MAVRAPAIDPIITNPTIRKCVENARDLRDEAVNLLKLIPLTLTSDQWQPVFDHDVLPFAKKISKFYGLRKSALTAADRLTVDQAPERTKLEATLKELDGRVGTIYTRIKDLQLQQGIQPFFIPQTTTQKSKSWLYENKGWIFSGFSATVASSQLAPQWIADPIANFTIGKYTTPSKQEYAIRPLYFPLFMLREAVGPKWSPTVGYAALGAAALYPTYRVLKKPVLAGCAQLDKGVNWLNNHPVLTLVASAGLSYAGMGYVDPKRLPADLGNRQILVGCIGIAATTVIWVAKSIFDEIKAYAKKDAEAPRKIAAPIVPVPPANQPPPPVNGVNAAPNPLDAANPLPLPPPVAEEHRSAYQKVKAFSLNYPFAAFPVLGAGGFAALGTVTAAVFKWPVGSTAMIASLTGAGLGLTCAAADRAARRELADAAANNNAAAVV